MTPAFGGQYSIQLSYGRFVGALFYSENPAVKHLFTSPVTETTEYAAPRGGSLRDLLQSYCQR